MPKTKNRGTPVPANKLPRGLGEYRGTLTTEAVHAPELVRRLLDLPLDKDGSLPLLREIASAEAISYEIHRLEMLVTQHRRNLRAVATAAFEAATKWWTVGELEKATGYSE